jgi:enoyl-[acyl-carrier-protein] reductase (NADH)
MRTPKQDLEERIDVLHVLHHSVILMENEELYQKLLRFKSDNVQWVLNMVLDTFDRLEEALDMEYDSSF